MDSIKWLLDLNDREALVIPILLKTIIIYFSTLIMVKIGNKRFFGRASAFDAILGIILGSVLSRAVNGTAPLLPTLCSGLILIFLHWVLAVLACKYHKFGNLIKGSMIPLIKNGVIFKDKMSHSQITMHDIMEESRFEKGISDLEEIDCANLERNGKISIIPVKKEAKIIDVNIEEGIKTVRLSIQ